MDTEKKENEIWKPVKDWEGMYEVSNLGRIKSLKRKSPCRNQFTFCNKFKNIPEIIKCPMMDRNGYLRTYLCFNGEKKCFSIHRLVAKHFIENPENKSEVNHKNSIRNDNRVENLEWCTTSENIKHAFKFGFQKPNKGEACGNSKLNEKQVRVIKHILKEKWLNLSKISRIFKVSVHAIWSIKKLRTWKDVII